MMLRKIIYFACLAVLLVGCATQPRGAKPLAVTPPVLPENSAPPPVPGLSQKKTPLRVFCAGSLIVPFGEIEKAFEVQHPDIDVLMECHGSIQVIRHVTDLHEAIDVVATADHALIPMLMYDSINSESGQPYANWAIRFASNRLALAYSARSQYADQINPENWYTSLAQPGVRVGLADPRFDASGYRALMALRLAEDYYQSPGILKKLTEGRFKIPITIFEEDHFTEIGVPEILEPSANSGTILRGASIQLIALIESGDLDYAFEYESVVRQHGLQWIALPDEINLGVEANNPLYNQVQVKLDFQRFASLKPIFKGEQIGYGITIPSNAPQPALAAEFIAFLFGPQGRQIMQENFQPLLEHPLCDQPDQMPPALQVVCTGETQP